MIRSLMESGKIPVRGGEIYYETLGDGHPLVLIHAGFLDRRMWDDQFESYSNKSYRVIRYDVRGFGKSSKATDKYSDIEDLNNLLEHLDVEKAFVIGVSNGGRIAIDYAINHPNRVDGLILVGSGVSGRQPQSTEESQIWKKLDKIMESQDKFLKSGRFKESSQIDVNAWGSMQSTTSRERMLRIAYENAEVQLDNPWKHQVNPTPPGYKRLSEIKAPTLVMVGDHDQEGMLIIADDLCRKIPGSRKVVVEGADHIVNMSNPDVFDRTVLNFFSGLIASQ